MLVGDILTSLFYSSAVIGLALCSLVVLHILFKNKKNKVVEA